MKFGKEFSSQMVHEWQEAYMNYNYLKSLLKEIHNFKQKRKTESNTHPSLNRTISLYRAFSGLTLSRRHHHHNHHHHHQSSTTPVDLENQTILVSSVNRDGSEKYETTFLMTAEEGGEYELVYFKRLDDELNKVDTFYRSKVKEVVKEAEMLNKQMDAFIAFRIKVENPTGWEWDDRTVELTRLASDIAISAAALSASVPSMARSSRKFDHMAIIDKESGSTKHARSENREHQTGTTSNNMIPSDEEIQLVRVSNNGIIHRNKPAPLHVLDRVTINKPDDSAGSTIKGLLRVPVQDELKFTRENLNKVEAKLKLAFVEFYQKLHLVKSYSFANTLAFSKIMKKYDKITSRKAAKAYMHLVDNSYLGSSDKVRKLIERVEATFIKHFANSNRSKGMSVLRPKAKREKHWTTFSTGFFAGCVISLIVALVMAIRTRHINAKPGQELYMNTMFPLYSLFGFIVLHMVLYAANIYFWRRYRVNYSFIFGAKQGTELGYREVLLMSFGLGAAALACVMLNLDMEMDPKTNDFKTITELLPLILVLLVILLVVQPFNILYRSSRYFFLKCLFRALAAPLYKVTLPDFLMADQLTSQVQALRSLEFYICYYGWGDFRHRKNTCDTNDLFNTFSIILSALPFWLRFLQCLRRVYDERDVMQGYNGIKYFLTIVAICLRVAYNLNKGVGFEITAWVFSVLATIFLIYWDIVFDWGLLTRNSKNLWLRDKLLVPYKSVYYIAMILDVLLRFAWMQTVLDFKFSFIHQHSMITIVASLEIIRRGVWNFFRLENEHLNNVGNFRAFKSVPLPFNYDDNDDKDD